jgi:hypothetical protein
MLRTGTMILLLSMTATIMGCATTGVRRFRKTQLRRS